MYLLTAFTYYFLSRIVHYLIVFFKGQTYGRMDRDRGGDQWYFFIRCSISASRILCQEELSNFQNSQSIPLLSNGTSFRSKSIPVELWIGAVSAFTEIGWINGSLRGRQCPITNDTNFNLFLFACIILYILLINVVCDVFHYLLYGTLTELEY